MSASVRFLLWSFMLLCLMTTAAVAQTPYLGAPVQLPGVIEAENYDFGGEGIAWHDTTAGNVFGAYRTHDMDVGAIPAGGYHIGFLADGEWAKYTVNVPYTQQYEFRVRAASAFPGPNNFHIELNGADVTGTQSIAPTGDWHNYVIKTIPVNLTAGNNKIIRVVFDTGAWNFDSLDVRCNTPYSGTPVNLPASRLQAENYDLGGEGIAWHDTTAGNVFGAYRSDDMDVGAIPGGGYHIGNLTDGEWAEYLVNVTAGGSYDLNVRYASAYPGTTNFRVLLDGVDIAGGSQSITQTGGWQTYTTKTVPVNVTAGNGKVLRIFFDVGSWNVDWLELVVRPTTMSILAHPAGSKNPNFRIQATGFSVSSVPNAVRVYGTAGYQQFKWNANQTAIDNLYHGTTPYPDFATLNGRQDCAHSKDPRLWDSRCSTDSLGYFWKWIPCSAGQACQDNDRWNASPGQYNLTPFPSPAVWPRTDDFGTMGYASIISHVSVNNTLLQPAQTDCSTPLGDTIWVADVVPNSATTWSDNETWNWVPTSGLPVKSLFPGQYSHQSAIYSGVHQHYFYNAASTLTVNAGEALIAYVYLDPANPPSQVMLQWNDGTWEHRAYWGANLLPWGVDGTSSRRYIGPLPATGGWFRLQVPASQVGLEGHTLNGMAFSLFGGAATWDHAGKWTPGVVTGVCPPKTGRSVSQTYHAYNPDDYATGTANSKAVQVKYADGSSRWFMAFNSMIKYMSVTYTDTATGQKRNDSNFGRSAADNWRVMWATSPDGANWTVHPQVLFRSPAEKDYPFTGLLMVDMVIDNGYFYVLFQDLLKPYLYLTRARIDPTNSASVPGYVQNSLEGWSVAANPIVGGQYTWTRVPLGEQINFDGLGAYPVMAAIQSPAGGFVKQGSLARIFKSSAPNSQSQIFGVTNDLTPAGAGVVQLWSAADITRPLTYVSDVIRDPSIVLGGNGWEFGFTHYPDNAPATPRIIGTGFEVWVAEQSGSAGVLLTRRNAQLSNF